MTEPQEPGAPSDDDLPLLQRMVAIHQEWKRHSSSSDLDEAIASLNAMLSEEVGEPQATKPQRIRTMLARVIPFAHAHPDSIQALLQIFEKTGRFSKVELKIMRRMAYLEQTETGVVRLRAPRLSYQQAALLLTILGSLGGLWIGRVLFTDDAGLNLMLQSLGFGVALGSLASLVLNESYRFARIAEKIRMIAPQLVANQPATN